VNPAVGVKKNNGKKCNPMAHIWVETTHNCVECTNKTSTTKTDTDSMNLKHKPFHKDVQSV